MFRYDDALDSATESLVLCDSKKGLRDVYCWPGTDIFIEHTDTAVLKKKLSIIVSECENPPRPDFRCIAESCTNFSQAIYIDDPDFRV